MKYILMVISLIVNSYFVFAQPTKNVAYVQFAGNSLLSGVNYEKDSLFKTSLAFHVGVGIYGIPTKPTFPIGVKYFFKRRKGKSYFAVGVGATYCKTDVQLYAIFDHKEPLPPVRNYFAFVPSFEGRTYSKSNWMFSWELTPIINHNGFIPSIGISFGKGF